VGSKSLVFAPSRRIRPKKRPYVTLNRTCLPSFGPCRPCRSSAQGPNRPIRPQAGLCGRTQLGLTGREKVLSPGMQVFWVHERPFSAKIWAYRPKNGPFFDSVKHFKRRKCVLIFLRQELCNSTPPPKKRPILRKVIWISKTIWKYRFCKTLGGTFIKTYLCPKTGTENDTKFCRSVSYKLNRPWFGRLHGENDFDALTRQLK